VRDHEFPTMWRIALPDGGLTDVLNRVRARDAAVLLAVAAFTRAAEAAA
jgi:hypothetical protein